MNYTKREDISRIRPQSALNNSLILLYFMAAQVQVAGGVIGYSSGMPFIARVTPAARGIPGAAEDFIKSESAEIETRINNYRPSEIKRFVRQECYYETL